MHTVNWIIEHKNNIPEWYYIEVYELVTRSKEWIENIISSPDKILLANLYNNIIKHLISGTNINYKDLNPDDIIIYDLDIYNENYDENYDRVVEMLWFYLSTLADNNIFNNPPFKHLLNKINNSLINQALKDMYDIVPEISFILDKFKNFKTVSRIQYVVNKKENVIENNKDFQYEYFNAKKSYYLKMWTIIENIMRYPQLFSEIEKEKMESDISKFVSPSKLEKNENLISTPFIKYFLEIIKLKTFSDTVYKEIEDIISTLLIDHVILNTKINNFTEEWTRKGPVKHEDFFNLFIYQIDKFYDQESIKVFGNNILRKLLEYKFDIKLNESIKNQKLKALIESELFIELDKTDNSLNEKILLYLENDKIFFSKEWNFKKVFHYIQSINEQDLISDVRWFFRTSFNKEYSEELLLFVLKNKLYTWEIIKNFEQIKYIHELSIKYNIDTDILTSLDSIILVKIKDIDNPEEQKDLENIINLIKEWKDVAIYFKNKLIIWNLLKELEYLNSSASWYKEIYNLLDNNEKLFTLEPLKLKKEISDLYEKYNIEDSILRNKQIILDKNPLVFTPILNSIYLKFNQLINKKDQNNKFRNKIIKDIFTKNDDTIFFLLNVLDKISDKKVSSYDILNNYINLIINNKHRIFLDEVETISFEELLKDINTFGENLKNELEEIYWKENYDFIRNETESIRINLRDLWKFLKNTGQEEDFLLYIDSWEIITDDISTIIKLYSLFNTLGIKLFIEDFVELKIKESNINYIWENIEYIDVINKNIDKKYIIDFCSENKLIETNQYIKDLLNIKEEENIEILATTFHNRILLKKDSLKLNWLKRINSIQCIKKLERLWFSFKNANWSHYKYHKWSRTVIVPYHSEELDYWMLKSIIISTWIETIEEWNEL